MSNLAPQAYTYPFQPQQPEQWNEFGGPDPAFLDRNGAYSPSFPTTPSMPALNQQYDTRANPSQYGTKPIFAPPPLPPMDYGQPASPYYVAFDPNAPDLTQSRFLGGMAMPQPHIFSPIPSAPATPFRLSSAQSFHPATPLYPLNTSPQSLSPSPAFYQPDTSSPQTPHSYSLSPSSPLPSNSPSPSAFLRTSEQAQFYANTAPQDPYSAATRANLGRRDTAPIPPATPVEPPPRSHSAGSLVRPLHTPPPPSPSSRFASFTPATDLGPPFDDPAGLLETIGEDGESQAGTTKSLAPGVAEALAANGSVRSVRGLALEKGGVEVLEEWVDEEERRKTLPPPPVPSERTKGASKVPRAQDIFPPAGPAAKDGGAAKTTRALLPPRDEGGLQALEQRLSRPSTPEIPSRAPLVPTPSNESLAPSTPGQPFPLIPSTLPLADTSRPLSPPSHQTGALQARSFSRPRSLEKVRVDAEDPKEAVRRALESAPAKIEVTKEEPATSVTRPSTSEPVSTSSSTSSIPPAKLGKSYVAGRKVVDVVEFNGLKKEAVSRVSNWLKDGGDEAKVPAPSSKASRRATFDFVRPAPSPPPPPTAVGKLSSLVNATPKALTRVEKEEPTVVELLEAEAKAMEGRKPASDATLLRGLEKEGPKPPALEGARYDVRSARGGRGGVVFSVANKWAEIIGEEQGVRLLVR